ncbi:PREDICTED: uncharacterized protein LOC101305737 [Fragaria vesca subsp. vesca]|uniref:uncharacterized protein LOC101305737 n=1 Tax=Fragaria vesca subsp. vesca TaxID=101020 RepID=UPI0002C32DD2|nr:PREDICTED: uncharacterized protein LOC101305737 [Fragaria vesca subsp. vesca]
MSMDDTPPAEELLNKFQLLEEGQEHRKQELPTLFIRDYSYSYAELENQRAFSVLPQYSRFFSKSRISSGSQLPSTLNFSNHQCLNILQSMGQSVYIFDLNCRIIYWNKAAGDIFGYSLAEALGQNVVELVADPQAFAVGHSIAQRLTMGESWTGQFPVRSKMGESFSIFTTNTPFCDDDDGNFIGVISVSSKVHPFQENRVHLLGVDELPEPDSIFGPCNTVATQLGFDPQQPLQNTTASTLTTLAAKVSNKVKTKFGVGKGNWDCITGKGDNPQCDHSEDGNLSAASSPRGTITPSPFAILSKIKDKFHKNSRCS